MRRRVLTLVAALVIAALAAASTTAQSRKTLLLSVLDLNIGGGEHLGGEDAEIVDFLTLATDNVFLNVITLQEVCGTQFLAIRAALGAEWLGTFRRTGRDIECTPDITGLAIFTRGSHTDVAYWNLPGRLTPTGERWWGLMKVHYRGVDIFTTHIKGGRVLRHTEAVVTQVQKSPLAVLSGDFNAEPDAPHILKLYQRGWHEVDADFEPTWQDQKIDYIWTTGDPVWIWGDAADSPSNHRALWGVIELPR